MIISATNLSFCTIAAPETIVEVSIVTLGKYGWCYLLIDEIMDERINDLEFPRQLKSSMENNEIGISDIDKYVMKAFTKDVIMSVVENTKLNLDEKDVVKLEKAMINYRARRYYDCASLLSGLIDSQSIKQELFDYKNEKYKPDINGNINKNIDKILSRYILSQLLLSLIIGVLSFVLLLVLRIKFPLVLSIINAIANIIPYFGPIIGGVPIIFMALTGSVTKGLLAAVGVFLIQQVEGNFLAPKITGDSTNMHPIIIIILLILGEKMGGVIGMVLIVPIAVIIKVIYDDIDYYLF